MLLRGTDHVYSAEELAKRLAERLLDNDPDLNSTENLRIRDWFQMQKGQTLWSKIS